MTALLPVALDLDERTSLRATVRRHPPEPEAGFPEPRYEVETLKLVVEWKQEPKRAGGLHSWRKHERDLTGEDFRCWCEAYQEKLVDLAEEEWMDRERRNVR